MDNKSIVEYRLQWHSTDPKCTYASGWDAATSDVRELIRRIKSLESDGYKVVIEKHVSIKEPIALEELMSEASKQHPKWAENWKKWNGALSEL
jgi:hypothetical protein